MKNNETIEPVVKQKSNKGLIVLIVILILMVLGLSGYLVYDKFMDKEEPPAVNETTNNNIQTDNSNKKVLKKDESKDVVYDYAYDKTSEKISKMPYININSVYADSINKKIEDIIKNDEYTIENNTLKSTSPTGGAWITYKSFINDNILSIILYEDFIASNNSHKYYSYNIDIYTGEEVTNKDLVKLKNINESDFEAKLSNTFKEAYPFDKYYPESQYGNEGKDFATQMYNKTTELQNCSIDNPMFLNENGELMVVLGVYYYAGGEGATYSIVNMDTKQFIYYEDYKM